MYIVCTKGLSSAIVLVKSTHPDSTLKINFTFDLTNLTPDSLHLIVAPNMTECIILRPKVLGEEIGVGVEMSYTVMQ